MEGKGIFDDLKRKGKKMVKKSVREGVDSLKQNVGEVAGATLGTAAAGAATSVGLPTLAPLAGAAGYQLGKSLTESAAEKAEKEFKNRTSRMRQPRNRTPAKTKPKAITLDDQVKLDNTLRGVNKSLGTNFGYLGSSGLGNLEAKK